MRGAVGTGGENPLVTRLALRVPKTNDRSKLLHQYLGVVKKQLYTFGLAMSSADAAVLWKHELIFNKLLGNKLQ